MTFEEMFAQVKLEGSTLPEADVKRIYAMAFNHVVAMVAESLASPENLETSLRTSAARATSLADMIAAFKKEDAKDEGKEEKPDDEKTEGKPKEEEPESKAAETPEPE